MVQKHALAPIEIVLMVFFRLENKTTRRNMSSLNDIIIDNRYFNRIKIKFAPNFH